ncbi:MAG: 16S rRNA (adenine(1518)-N(6)/adenine(1519)-N(6))-dimethyltransferase RsmA [Chitinophagales bacterium]
MLHLKKSLGQHFLHDQNMLQRIADAIGDLFAFASVVEIGPGMGALTQHLVKQQHPEFYVVELDDRWAAYLPETFPALKGKVIHADILRADLRDVLKHPTHIVGNFPYNISSQIVFRIIDERDTVTCMTGMFQKEMAVRIAAKPGSKDYGVISVLTQAYYDASYLFDVPPGCFNPPPKVMSGILQLHRKQTALQCDEVLFKKLVKQAFTQRRKTLRNSLKPLLPKGFDTTVPTFDLRPEQLAVADFEALTNQVKSAAQ